MYAVGVTGLSEGSFWGSGGAGVYLFGQEEKGWGVGGGGIPGNYEPLGQYEGRWFLFLPFGVAPVDEYPSVVSYNGRVYICGGYTYNLIIDEHHRIWRQGIRPPEEAPSIAGAAGATNLAYLSWFDELTGERSPLSLPTEIGDAVPRTWSSLPTRPPDDVYVNNDEVTCDATGSLRHNTVRFPRTPNKLRQVRGGDRISLPLGGTDYGMVVNTNAEAIPVAPAVGPGLEQVIITDTDVPISPVGGAVIVAPVIRATHLELWLAMAGDLPRLAMRVAVGTTSVVESKGVGDLGEAFVTQFQRFPRCSMNAIYHDRQVMAGDGENPDTVYLSALFEPERFEGLSFRTRDGKAITGLLATRDFCMVFTKSSAFLLQGYTDTDYTLNPVDQSIGAVGHLCNTVIHGNPYVLSEKGPYMYNGAWHPLSPENHWTPPALGTTMIATEDPYFNSYIISQAYRVARSFNEPYAQWDQSGVEIQGGAISERSKYFAVLDYTLVQPETGGVVAPARLMWDTTDFWEHQGEGTEFFFDDEVFMKYLRNRYARGNLYRIFGMRKGVPGGFNPYDALDWTNSSPSFVISGMLLPGAGKQLDLAPADTGVIITPFDYLGDGGGFLMEQKQIKRVWYYMRMEDGTVDLYMAPGPGYWGGRVYPVTQAAIVYTTTFVGGDYRLAPEAIHGDVIMPPTPDFLSGRGMWLRITGTGLFFAGFGVETIWGAEVFHAPL